jgi:hypothetical protein
MPRGAPPSGRLINFKPTDQRLDLVAAGQTGLSAEPGRLEGRGRAGEEARIGQRPAFGQRDRERPRRAAATA